MIEEQKRINIAEACGWKPYPKENVGADAVMFDGDVWFRDKKTNTIATPSQLPDYFNDLNACHEMEKAIYKNMQLWWDYCAHIGRLTVSDLIHASSSVRAEAFGLTLKLWKEGE